MKRNAIKNKNAFSILELLTVVTIILVVSTVTIPLVKLSYEKKILYDKFRTAFMEINSSLSRSIVENDSIKKWNLFNGNSEKILNTYFEPYFTNVKTIKCSKYKQKIRNLSEEKEINACKFYNVTPPNNSVVKFKHIIFGLHDIDLKTNTLSVAIDVNGLDMPNMVGRDIFIFKINDSIYEPIAPSGVMNQNCSLDLLPRTGVIQGEGCADRLMTEGIMNY